MQNIIKELAKHGFEVDIPAGKVLFEQGEVAQILYYIKKGEIRIENSNGQILDNLKTGAHFGELAMVIKNHVRSAKATVTVDSKLIFIDRAIYDKLAIENTPLIVDLLEQITNTLFDSEQRLIKKNIKLADENLVLTQTGEHLSMDGLPTTTESAKQFKITDYILTEQIGKGGYAEVYLATSIKTKEQFAIKVYDTVCKKGKQNRSHFDSEVTTLKGLKHQNICGLINTGENSKCVYMVVKAYLGGSLYDRIAHQKLTQKRIFFFFKMVLSSLEYLHLNGIVYKDLKAQNILSDKHGNLALSDFGSSSIPDKTLTGRDGEQMVMLSPYYMSPEQTRNEKLDYLTDYYSMGILLFEMVVGHKPFIENTLDGFIQAHQKKQTPRLSKKRAAYQDLIDGLTAKSKFERFQNINQVKSELMKVAVKIGIIPKQ